MTEPTIDRATFDELKEAAGAEFVVELIDTFLTEAPLMLAELSRAFAQREAEAFRRAAHSLKSNANTFGANALGAMGEIGLGQIRYEIWGRELKDAGIISRKSDLWHPQVNLRATDWIFSQLTGGTQERFRRYNGAGPKARQYAREQQRALERL